MSAYTYVCPECGATILCDLKGGGRSNFGGAFCTGSEDEPHTATKMEEQEDG
jgi:hypothetical protein